MPLRLRAALLLTFLFAAGMGFYYFGIFLPHSLAARQTSQVGAGYSFGGDFYPIWLTSRECLVRGCDPYSPQITQEIQTGLFGRVLSSSNPGDPSSDYRTFSYPAYVDVFGLLLAWLPFSSARIVLAVLLPSLIAASVLLWTHALRWTARPALLVIFVVLTLFSYPGLEALFAEQVGLVVAFLLAAAFAALVANKPGWTGCLLALATIKPQVCAFVVLYLLLWTLADWRERWKFAASFFTTLAALASSALLIWPRWITSWLHVLLDYRDYSRPPLLGSLFGPSLGKILIAIALIASVGFAWHMRRLPPASPQFRFTIALLLALTTVTLLPEHAVYDHVILLPGIMLIVRFWREACKRSGLVRCTFSLAAGAICWQWIAALLVVALRFASPRVAAILLFLPLRTAPAIPFLVLGVLWVMTRERGLLTTPESL